MVRLPPGLWTLPLVLLALSACNQSLFDENVDDDDGGQTDDGDGDDIGDDVPSDDGGDDFGDDGGDDGGNVGCPEPCQGDPVVEFSLDQGGTSGRWLYLADRGDTNGSGYDQLTAGTYQGAPAWVVDDDAGPAIVSCAGNAPPEICAGVTESLVFVPSVARAADDPALAFRAPNNGTYRFIGRFRLPDGVEEGVQSRFLVSRNGRHDVLLRPNFLGSATAADLQVDVEALAGDQIVLAMPRPASGSGQPLAFDFAVTLLGGEEDIFPGRCMFAATFDEDDPFTEKCGGATLANLNADETLPGVTEGGPSVNDLFGSARVFDEARYMQSMGPAMDYSGDFTIQFWAQFAEPQPSFDAVPFSDAVDDAFGGVVWILDPFQEPEPLRVCYLWEEGAEPVLQSGCFAVADAPRDGEWHFHRVSRDAAEGTLSYCIDGALKGSDTAPGAFDMSSDRGPFLGKGVFSTFAYYGGSTDDVRIFRRALPCASFP